MHSTKMIRSLLVVNQRYISRSRFLRSLTIDNMNPYVKNVEYAVRGPIVAEALDFEKRLAEGEKFSFDEVIKCNIGDCHAVGQTPIEFLRQVVALSVYPELMETGKFPDDAVDRAKRVLKSCAGGSLGSYTISTGLTVVREDIAKFIENRDNLPADPDNIFLCTGASEGIKIILQMLCTQKTGSESAGIMIPIPQYPLYSATNSEYGAYQIPYYLDEANFWGLKEDELERSIAEASKHCKPRAIVIINPGNPTGQVLTRAHIDMVIAFAARHNLVVLADEVYQFNVYAPDRSFASFKSALQESVHRDQVQLASFMSASKGYMGECGFRGGYCEITNFPDNVTQQLYKLLSARLCTSVAGQAMVEAIVNPPHPHEPSYTVFSSQKQKVLDDLALKGQIVHSAFNNLPGYICQPIQGAMYAFPQLQLPEGCIKAAKKLNQTPDFFYCSKLLAKTGICVVPGSGFGQLPGTYHFRITILPPVDKIKKVIERIQEFHTEFMQEYK